MVTASTSPALAPFTNSGPVSGWMRFRLAPATTAGPEERLNGLSNASRVSNTTVSPGLAVAADLINGCHRLWHVPNGSSAQATGTLFTRVTGIRTCLARDGADQTATSTEAVNAAVFMGYPPVWSSTGELVPPIALADRDCQRRWSQRPTARRVPGGSCRRGCREARRR